LTRPSENQYPPDPELTDDEKTQYVTLIDNYHYGEAFNLQQAFLLRKRLNILNLQIDKVSKSSTKVEKAT